MLARGAAGTRARAELCMSAVWHSRVNHLSIAGGKGEQNTGQGSRFIKAEPSFFWSFFLFSFSVYLFFFFFLISGEFVLIGIFIMAGGVQAGVKPWESVSTVCREVARGLTQCLIVQALG